ncbi:MAG: hypothetical protein NTX64_12800 [Elusimicrobia bacterium]|nr:hypothetical protein [Elusimicrobiota bacterium]
MSRGVLAAGALLALAAAAWWAARKCSPPAAVSGRDAAVLRTLDEILRSRNDNDPRLDSGFNDLSPEARRLLRKKYAGLAPELRNERGTIVYLLGKNLSSAEDWAFLRQAAAEPPCLSLADCSKRAPMGPGDAITLAYPALVALEQAKDALRAGVSTEEARSVVEAGKSSKVPAVVEHAARIEATTKVQGPAKP